MLVLYVSLNYFYCKSFKFTGNIIYGITVYLKKAYMVHDDKPYWPQHLIDILRGELGLIEQQMIIVVYYYNIYYCKWATTLDCDGINL